MKLLGIFKNRYLEYWIFKNDKRFICDTIRIQTFGVGIFFDLTTFP